MKITKQLVEHVESGNLRVSIDYNAAGKVEDVSVVVKDGPYSSFCADAEVIERVAHILQTRRLACGDDSYVCSDCGYVEELHDCEAKAKELIR